MSTSFIGNVSIIEVYGNVCSLYFMLEELKKKSREKYYIVVVREVAIKSRFLLCVRSPSGFKMI